jgi:L-seryl-tRNA(Ser) seleniumtransferase
MSLNKPTIYESLGVSPIINAAGTFTDLGGSLMSAEVIAAWQEAAKQFVDLRELQDRVGERIADMLDVDAALVTGGAASGILLGTAAAITVRDPRFVQQQAVSANGRPYEVIRQHAQRDIYDRQIETCGVKIVEVESADELPLALSDRTVMMMAYNLYGSDSDIDHEAWLEFATTHSIPTLLDASADTPPVENLGRYAQMGFDMVAFSGGKAIGGPQSSGLLVGRRKWIEAAKQNAIPNEGTIGRVAKVSKEDIVALWKALEIYLAEGDKIASRCQRQLDTIVDLLAGTATVDTQFITPEIANHFPHLLLRWDEAALHMTAGDLASELREGSPPIATGRVHGTGTEGLLISAINLQPGEEQIVGARIREIFIGR